MSVDYKKLELKLRKIVEKRLEEGWNVEHGNALFQQDCRVCAIGAVIASDVPSMLFFDQRRDAENQLGLSSDEIMAISDGFEGFSNRRSINSSLYDIGARIRAHYCEST